MRASLLLFLAAMLGCSVSIPNGELRCGADEPCPPGYACVSARCYAPGTDVGADLDAGPQLDAPTVPETFVDVACGNNHSCAVTSSGRVFCWGADTRGQVGEDGVADSLPITRAALVPSLTGIDEVALGSEFTCALDVGSAVYCWGANGTGQLGDPSVAGSAPSPRAISSLANPTDLAAGRDHACAIDDGAVWCWGAGGAGQLGDGGTTTQRAPVRVTLEGDAVQVTAGLQHTCALLVDGSVWCWGNDTNAELGVTEPPSADRSEVPVRVNGLPSTIDAIGAFGGHTCVRAAERLHCWGRNASGELGSGATSLSSETAVEVMIPAGDLEDFGGGGFEFFGVWAHTCAVVDADLFCWGRTIRGEVGTGSSSGNILMPTRVSLNDVTRVAGGDSHTCAVAEGAVYCWGNNDDGQLGNESETSTMAPGAPIPVP